MSQHLTRFGQANLLAGHAVAYATAFLDGRHNAEQLADNADRLFIDMLVVETNETSTFLIPVQLLVITMMRAAKHAREIAQTTIRDERSARWEQVLGSLVELVCHDSNELRRSEGFLR